MSDLGQIHEKINETNTTLARIEGELRATLPHLATKTDLVGAIAAHKESCIGNVATAGFSRSDVGKLMAKIFGLLTLLAASVWGLVQMVM